MYTVVFLNVLICETVKNKFVGLLLLAKLERLIVTGNNTIAEFIDIDCASA